MNTTRFSSGSFTKFVSLLVALALLSVSTSKAAESPDDIYLNIVNAIDQADSMAANGQMTLAYNKYLKAQKALTDFKHAYPLSNPRAVTYRLNYLADKITAITPTAKTSTTTGDATKSIAGSRSETKTASASSHGLKLLSDGAEPRAILRVHPAAGDKQSLTMINKMAMTMTMGDTAMPSMKLPASQMTMDAEVKNIAANGDITYDITISDASVVNDPDVMPQVADAMKASMANFRGITGTGTMSDRGVNLTMEMNAPANADPTVRQTLEQLKESVADSGAAFPDEAVGIGARWQVSKKLKSQGMTIDQTTTYELVSNEEGRVSLKASIAQSALNQKIQSPTMPGAKVDLTKMTGTGTGTTSLDLAKILPTESDMNEHMEMEMSLNLGGQKQTMSTKMDMNVHIGGN